MYDRMLDYGEEWLATTDLKVDDPRAFLAVLGVMKMSLLTSGDLLSRALGVDVGTPDGWSRMMRAALDVCTYPLVTPELAEQAKAALDRFASGEDTP